MRKAALLGLALIAIGLIALVFNVKQPAFTMFAPEMIEINEKEVFASKLATSIEVNVSSPRVNIVPTESDDITVELTGEIGEKVDYAFDVNLNRETLVVNVGSSATASGIFNFNAAATNLSLNVFLPKKDYDTLNIQTSSGKISLQDLQAKRIRLQASSGKINVSNVVAETQVKLVSSSGNVEAKTIESKSISVTTSSGSVSLNQLTGESTSVTTSSGSIQLADTNGDLTTASSSGHISIRNDDVKEDITIATSSGNVDINIRNTPTSATVDFRGSTGKGDVRWTGFQYEGHSNNHLYGSIGSGDNKITIRTSSGNLKIN